MSNTPQVIVAGPQSEGHASIVEVRDLNHLGILALIWDDLDLTGVLNQAIGTDPQMNMTPGLALKAMVLDVLCGRTALYQMEHRWESVMPYQKLLGPSVHPNDLNDTSLGRHLDRMHRAGCSKVFDAVCLRAILHEKLSVRRPLNLDSSSKVMFGAYRNSDRPDVISVTHGHSKDHRPDLLQLMFGLMVDADGVPVLGRVLDGNTEDKSWFGRVIRHLRCWQKGLPEGPLEFVGDAALINEPNVRAAQDNDIILTGRSPRTVGACLEMVNDALKKPDAWVDLGVLAADPNGTRYQGQRMERQVFGVDMQVGIYRAATSQQRARRSAERRAKRALVAARKEAKALAAMDHHCEPDALEAMAAARTRLAGALLQGTGEITTEYKPIAKGRGRPSKDLQGPIQQVYRIALNFEIDQHAVETQARDESCFVIVHTGKAPLSEAEILSRYKSQATIEKL